MNERGDRRGLRAALLATLGACFIYMVQSGIRNNSGLMLQAIAGHTGLNFSAVSFVLAVSQLCYGIAQPFFGLLAERRGSRMALLIGVACTVAGTLLTPLCRNLATLTLIFGALLSAGVGALSFGIIMGAIGPRVGERYQMAANGVLNASSGVGSTAFAPVLGAASAAGGLTGGMAALTACALCMLPVALAISRGPSRRAAAEAKPSAGTVTFAAAMRCRDYRFIFAGFFTCGFHMAIISNHLATEIMSFGHSYAAASGFFSIYGVATIAGCLLTGALCNRLRLKNVLAALYGLRALAVAAYLLLPKGAATVCLYILILGMTGSATVTPVSAICGKLFGSYGVTVLFSAAFLAHQVGSFLSAWAGGLCFEGLGSYAPLWIVDILLCAFAALVSFAIQNDGLTKPET